MILMRANPLLGPLEGVGPKKSRFSGLTPSKGFVTDVVRIASKSQNYYVPRHINNKYQKINSCAAYIGIGGMKIENKPRH